MPYYHIHVVIRGQEYYEYDQLLQSVEKLAESFNKGNRFLFSGIQIDPHEVGKIRIYETQSTNRDIIGARVWDVGINVTRRFIKSPPSDAFAPRPLNKDVFIVHGEDNEAVKELKAMLSRFGLNPTVLHEQASGSRTIIEKLEKYSKVGFVFVILTPDDMGSSEEEMLDATGMFYGRHYDSEDLLEGYTEIKFRARQNVILEFGYFTGKLGRDKVCCLHKGNVELPSDMHGIVYIPFKESVNEARDKIIKELKAAGYRIGVKKRREEDKKAREKLEEISKEVEKVLNALAQKALQNTH